MATVSAKLDSAVRRWFDSHGLSVHETHNEFKYDFFAWRHYGNRRALTLWISEIAAEDYEPETLLYLLKDFELVALMDELGHAHLHIVTHEGIGAYARANFSPTEFEPPNPFPPKEQRPSPADPCQYARCGGLGFRKVNRIWAAHFLVVIGGREWRVCEGCADLLSRAATAEGRSVNRELLPPDI